MAGMLKYAWLCRRSSKKKNAVLELLDDSADIGMEHDEQNHILLPLITLLFRDAKVKWKRTNARGQGYSIAEQTIDDFLRWDFMPWE